MDCVRCLGKHILMVTRGLGLARHRAMAELESKLETGVSRRTHQHSVKTFVGQQAELCCSCFDTAVANDVAVLAAVGSPNALSTSRERQPLVKQCKTEDQWTN